MSLIIKELSKEFAKRKVVHRVSFELKQSQIMGLLGPNGAGKTTLFYMIAGLINSDEGAPVEPVVYLVDGEAASWFYRINSKKGEMENLNSPSAEFKSYSEVGKQFGEHAHGWHALVSELSMLAMGAESQKQMEG